MTKREIKSIEKVKQEYLLNLRDAEAVLNLPPHEYEQLDESVRRSADRQFGYAEGIYQTLALLGQADGLPEIDF